MTEKTSFYNDEDIWKTTTSGLQGLLDGEAIRQEYQLHDSPFDDGDNFENIDSNYGKDFELLMQLDSPFQAEDLPLMPEHLSHGLSPTQSTNEGNVGENQHATSTASEGRIDDNIVCYGMVSVYLQMSNNIDLQTVYTHNTPSLS